MGTCTLHALATNSMLESCDAEPKICAKAALLPYEPDDRARLEETLTIGARFASPACNEQ